MINSKILINYLGNLDEHDAKVIELKNLIKSIMLNDNNNDSDFIQLQDASIEVGSLVTIRSEAHNIYRVVSILKEKITCVDLKKPGKTYLFNEDDLVVVAKTSDPIYPYLKPIGSLCNNPNNSSWNSLIEGENYEVLKLLKTLYSGKVDCIYIDPPSYNENTRIRNNYSTQRSYLDKWISMMKKRLEIAKPLLNPEESVLIIEVGEKECHYLGCVLDELFPKARIQMINTIINPSGVIKQGMFTKTNEYLYFVMLGKAKPSKLALNDDWRLGSDKNYKKQISWHSLKRDGEGSKREDRPTLFYPIIVNNEVTKIVRVGNSLPLDMDRNSIKAGENELIVWPLLSNGEEGRWRLKQDTLEKLYKKGFVHLRKVGKSKVSITYLTKGERERVNNGTYTIIGRRVDGSILVNDLEDGREIIPGTQWSVHSHNANRYGSLLLKQIFKEKRFNHPKSIYEVRDALKFFLKDKPDALILDFFAGSGTTLHAVNLLNEEDQGNRRCILVTNNDVSKKQSKKLLASGLKPGDQEYGQYGIAQYVTWPRIICSIKGVDIEGNPLDGEYLDSDLKLKDGFKTNVNYFRLEYLDSRRTVLINQLRKLLPLLWFKAGMIGKCPKFQEETVPDILVSESNKFALLFEDFKWRELKREVDERKDIQTLFIVSDSKETYDRISKVFQDKTTYYLNRNLVKNFK